MADLYNVEIKARARDVERVRRVLSGHRADVRPVERQVDTYFHCPRGRLKLRQAPGGDELIFYRREDRHGPKASEITLERLPAGHDLLTLLERALGVRAVVDKRREIAFVGNVKFHVDSVLHLGEFVEIEAIDADGRLGHDHLLAQCEHFMALFGIEDADLLATSYGDLVAESGQRAVGRPPKDRGFSPAC